MDDKTVLTICGTAIATLLGKIIFDWLRGSRNHYGGADAVCVVPHNWRKIFEEMDDMHGTVAGIHDTIKWMKDVHDTQSTGELNRIMAQIRIVEQKVEAIGKDQHISQAVLKTLLEEIKVLTQAIITLAQSTKDK